MAFVTRSNWEEALVEARAHIRQAAFVAVDLELSGVQTTPWRGATEVDNLHTRYLNLRDSAEKFAMIQFGLCPVVWDAASVKFIAYPYNFCLFPRHELQIEMPARDFLCQATSLEFLAKHQFDFNACIYDGISYLSHEQEKLARHKLKLTDADGAPRELESFSVLEIPLNRTADVIFSESVRVQAGEWRDKVLQREKDAQEPEERLCLVVEVAGNHEANLVHQVLRKSFQDLVPFTEDGAKKVKILFSRSVKERALLVGQWEKDRRSRLENQIMDAVGFRQLIDTLVESKKPVVGHNCFLDIAHIYSKFFATLPLSCSEFCSSIHQHFPCIFDTKYLLKADSAAQEMLGKGGTTLGPVFSNVGKLPNKVPIEFGSSNLCRYDGTEMKHEAGYDAYMTAAVFANICQFVKMDPANLPSLCEQAKEGEEERSGLGSHANHLYLGWRGHFVLDLSTGQEATGPRSLKSSRSIEREKAKSVALMWGSGSTRSSEVDSRSLEADVKACFTAKSPPHVEVVRIDESSAFVVFRRKESLESLVQAFECSGHHDKVGVCDVSGLVARGWKIARYEFFEKLCESPLSTAKLTDAVTLMHLQAESSSSRKRPRL
ncbi:hypothetical protein SELMODRAFT_446815 [Selaginella moellendorffii]|uniref:Uncharacterized protein n=1 Tax=Selaginella moellendorffii TaxID=88036 RepID=D8SUM2_SELML|nr:poly(A)-specific ribonuclease PARN isoform X2 [Selaginella moellendorffii]EFJ11857.1 hypothetical protein SELMODRAFT_446815 [Selaginella moellendorffii]|eukprot:XP_002987014.1 poly(A)-specific ribonuclease PARN isoform X2 [Selaginella moellendorffii]